MDVRSIDEAQHRALVAILGRLRAEHRARFVFLADGAGRPVCAAGTSPDSDLDAVASLVASTAAAASRLSELLGEGGASFLLQRGEADVVQLLPGPGFVLAVVYDGGAPRGVERLRARLRQRRAVVEVAAVFAAPSPAGAPSFAEEEVADLVADLDASEA